MKDIGTTIKDYIAQSILIVFSVVLGLYLSERIEDRKSQQEASDLLKTIKLEVQDNLELLKKWTPYHQQMVTVIDTLLQQESFVESFVVDKDIIFSKLFTRGTFMGRMPSADAWEIAKSHPLVVKIDYEKYAALSKIYNQQEMTYDPALKMFDLLNTTDVNDRPKAKENLELIAARLRECAARERQLMYYYDSAMAPLGITPPAEASADR